MYKQGWAPCKCAPPTHSYINIYTFSCLRSRNSSWVSHGVSYIPFGSPPLFPNQTWPSLAASRFPRPCRNSSLWMATFSSAYIYLNGDLNMSTQFSNILNTIHFLQVHSCIYLVNTQCCNKVLDIRWCNGTCCFTHSAITCFQRLYSLCLYRLHKVHILFTYIMKLLENIYHKTRRGVWFLKRLTEHPDGPVMMWKISFHDCECKTFNLWSVLHLTSVALLGVNYSFRSDLRLTVVIWHLSQFN